MRFGEGELGDDGGGDAKRDGCPGGHGTFSCAAGWEGSGVGRRKGELVDVLKTRPSGMTMVMSRRV